MEIKMINNKVSVDGKHYGNKPTKMDTYDYILQILFYTNRDGKKDYRLSINGVDETDIFKQQIKERYQNIINERLRDRFYLYTRVAK